MPSLGGVMLSPRRLSRKSKTAQSRLNSLAPAIIRQRRAESSCFIFVQKSEKGSLKIANPELYNQCRGAPGSGFAKKSGALLVSAKPLVKNGAQPIAGNIAKPPELLLRPKNRARSAI
jgi:hypothetical protein